MGQFAGDNLQVQLTHPEIRVCFVSAFLSMRKVGSSSGNGPGRWPSYPLHLVFGLNGISGNRLGKFNGRISKRAVFITEVSPVTVSCSLATAAISPAGYFVQVDLVFAEHGKDLAKTLVFSFISVMQLAVARECPEYTLK